MEAVEVKKTEAVALPKCEFADEGDSCADCDWGDDYKDGGLFGSDKVLCMLDGKWHKASYVCRNYK